jgi:hypothetical protein
MTDIDPTQVQWDDSAPPSSAQPSIDASKVAWDDEPPVSPARPGHAAPLRGDSPFEYAGKSIVGAAENVLSGITGGAGSLADALTGSDPGAHDWAYRPRSDAGKEISQGASELATTVGHKIAGATGMSQPLRDTLAERLPEALGAVSTALPILKGAGSLAGRGLTPKPIAPVISPEDAVANTVSQHFGSAAAAAPDLSVAPPELKSAISQAAQKTGGIVNPIALERHLDTAQLPLPEGMTPLQLRRGQALNDAQQISDEKNLRADPDTQGILTDSINDQDKKLVASMGEIRQRATPDIVQRDNQEHGQAIIDAIKDQDNRAVLDIRAKYKALADANGGDLPIDTGATLDKINQKLKKGALRNIAKNNGVISEVMSNLSSGEPMDFETFENARTQLANEQRKGGSDAAAATIVHNALNEMPLTPEAQGLRDLANVARQAAKARFETIKQNPAYDAAINDNVPKDSRFLHVIGAPSPLADKFVDQYALGNGTNASEAYINRLKQSVPNPIVGQSIEAATLNKLRDAAGIDAYGNGSFKNASYASALKSIAPKQDALLSPDSIEHVQRLGRVSDYVNNEGGKGNSVNRSGTALALQRFGAQFPKTPTVKGQLIDYGADAVAGHFGPVGVLGKKIGQSIFSKSMEARAAQSVKDAKLKFAQDATQAGAGLDSAVTAPRPQRASGGKVEKNVDVLVERLIKRWREAKKATDASTKPLLRLPDSTVVKALDIAGRSI